MNTQENGYEICLIIRVPDTSQHDTAKAQLDGTQHCTWDRSTASAQESLPQMAVI
jgi:hypothetical protein